MVIDTTFENDWDWCFGCKYNETTLDFGDLSLAGKKTKQENQPDLKSPIDSEASSQEHSPPSRVYTEWPSDKHMPIKWRSSHKTLFTG